MQEDVILSFVLPESQVTLHEPIFVNFSIRNQLTEAVQFDLGHNRKTNFEFIITEPDGSIIQVPRLSMEEVGRLGRLSLGPNDTYTQRLLLNEWHSFTKLGNYTIEARLSDAIRTLSHWAVQSKLADVMSLYIHDRDPERLRHICEILARTAIQSINILEVTEAALALSYILDSTAVPYLALILRNGKLVRSYAIQGLGRIANAEAIEILILTAKSGEQEVESQARFILHEIKGQVHDQRLKERIEAVLQ